MADSITVTAPAEVWQVEGTSQATAVVTGTVDVTQVTWQISLGSIVRTWNDGVDKAYAEFSLLQTGKCYCTRITASAPTDCEPASGYADVLVRAGETCDKPCDDGCGDYYLSPNF